MLTLMMIAVTMNHVLAVWHHLHVTTVKMQLSLANVLNLILDTIVMETVSSTQMETVFVINLKSLAVHLKTQQTLTLKPQKTMALV